MFAHLRQEALHGTQTFGITADMNWPSGQVEAHVVLCKSL